VNDLVVLVCGIGFYCGVPFKWFMKILPVLKLKTK